MKLPMFSLDGGIISNEEFISNLCSYEFPTSKVKNSCEYINVPAAFDIETSSFYLDGNKRACMYIWQFGIYNWVTTGRTWDSFVKLLNAVSGVLNLSEDRRLIIYIHNLAYEFQFMRKHFEWDKTFFLEERRPVYALVGGIEFRCSLKLSGKSLENTAKDLMKYKCEKQVGSLDYTKVRTPETPLDLGELKYCEYDIRVMLAYIMEKIESDGNISRIPLTNTGYVRNYCRRRCFKQYKLYRTLMDELTLSPDEYKMLKAAFQGGFTHANAKYVGKEVHDVTSYDFTSSYPATMVLEKFPMSKAHVVNQLDFDTLKKYLHTKCCLFEVSFTNLVPKIHIDHPLSESKCKKLVNGVTDNGRVVTAELATTTCTEQDFFIYQAFYDWDEIRITKFLYYDKAYLPKDFVLAILDLYMKKTVLKDVDGEEVNYLISKGMLNSAYGMAVTDIVRDVIEYLNNEFSTTKPDLEEAINVYNTSNRRFLYYPWGVWVTAYARANLFSGILACGRDYLYADTDSVKVINAEAHADYFNNYNLGVLKKIEKAAKHHNIGTSQFSPTTRGGKSKTIGVWDFDGKYDTFKTLGAKRYITHNDRGWKLTVAGLNKKTAINYILETYKNPADGLHIGLRVPPAYSGRFTLTYIDEETSGWVTDYMGNEYEFSELSSIHMESSDYTLSISDDFERFLQFVKGAKEYVW